jgi:voltage-gated sodium channel
MSPQHHSAELEPHVSWRERIRTLVEGRRFQQAIIGVIIINAGTLGLETSVHMRAEFGDALHVIDQVALGIFVAELLAKLYAYRWRFFRDPWNCFDFVIIGISLLPTSGGLSVLRSLRILRALRLVSAIPSMRRVVAALLGAVPGMASIFSLLALILYVAGVMATKLFGHTSDYFKNLPTTLFTLFQVTTGEAWPDVARDVMEEQPAAWLFFVIYILTSSFVVLNLFIAVVVSAMEEYEDDVQEERQERQEQQKRRERQERGEPRQDEPAADRLPEANGQGERAEASNEALLAELRALRDEVRSLREAQGAVLQARQASPEAAAAAASGEPGGPTASTDGKSQYG